MISKQNKKLDFSLCMSSGTEQVNILVELHAHAEKALNAQLCKYQVNNWIPGSDICYDCLKHADCVHTSDGLHT